MKTEKRRLAELQPADYNPRVTLTPDDPEYEALKNSLTRFGTASPIIVNEKTGNVVSGHQRLNILLDMGEEETEVILLDMDADDEKLLNVALNKIDGEWDYGKLEALFDEIRTEDIPFTGFTVDELAGLFSEPETSTPELEDRDDDAAGKKAEKKPKEFTIFVSFPSKEGAEEWLERQGIASRFSNARNMTVKMEGPYYGSSAV